MIQQVIFHHFPAKIYSYYYCTINLYQHLRRQHATIFQNFKILQISNLWALFLGASGLLPAFLKLSCGMGLHYFSLSQFIPIYPCLSRLPFPIGSNQLCLLPKINSFLRASHVYRVTQVLYLMGRFTDYITSLL